MFHKLISAIVARDILQNVFLKPLHKYFEIIWNTDRAGKLLNCFSVEHLWYNKSLLLFLVTITLRTVISLIIFFKSYLLITFRANSLLNNSRNSYFNSVGLVKIFMDYFILEVPTSGRCLLAL